MQLIIMVMSGEYGSRGTQGSSRAELHISQLLETIKDEAKLWA
jgi:hypothetical protein